MPPFAPTGHNATAQAVAGLPGPQAMGEKGGKRGCGGKGGKEGAACVMAVGLHNPARGPGMDAGATCNNLRR